MLLVLACGFRQRQREGVTPKNNSVVMFRRALGHRNLSAETSDEYFRQLGKRITEITRINSTNCLPTI